MPDEVTPERVAVFAASARIPLDEASAARVARAVSPTKARFAAEGIALPLEVEPASFLAAARKEIAP